MMGMSRLGHLHAFVTTPFDRGVFTEVHRQRVRRTIAYVLFLVLLSTVAVTWLAAARVNGLVDRILPVVDKIPTITLRDGEASADVEQPWVRRVGESNGRTVVLIIDTTGTLDGFRADQCGAFLMKRSLLVRNCEHEARQNNISLKRFPDGTIGPQVLRDWLAKARWLIPLIVAAAALVWFTLAKLAQALLLVLIALAASTGRQRPLTFAELFTVGVYGLGPAVLFDCLTFVLPIRFPISFVLYAAIAIGYTIAGARRIPDDPQLTLV
jgi:hypothetical protein